MPLPIVITAGSLGHLSHHEQIHAIVNDAIDSVFDMALDSAGLLTDRPAASRSGRYYLATDENVLYRDSGTGWVAISSYLSSFLIDLLSSTENISGIRVPAARLGKSVNQSVPDNSDTAITFDVETGDNYIDNDGMHSIVSATSRITFQRAGMSLVGGTLNWASNATGSRRIRIQKTSTSGATVLGTEENEATTGTNYTSTVTLVRHAIGDYVELLGRQTSGGSLAVETGSSFWAIYQSV